MQIAGCPAERKRFALFFKKVGMRPWAKLWNIGLRLLRIEDGPEFASSTNHHETMIPNGQSQATHLSEESLGLVYAAIDEVNGQSAEGPVIEKTPDTRLLGGKSGVDSLTFVNLIVALEEQIQNSLGKSIVLVNEETMSLSDHPFRTVGTLAGYVETMVAD